MGPSRQHEGIKSSLGRLLEAYCTERGIAWSPYGSWLLDDKSEDAGAEPDECYIFGSDPKSKPIPDLVIEVVWTSGGINKREICRTQRDESEWVPGVDLALLCRLTDVSPVSVAVAELHEILRALK